MVRGALILLLTAFAVSSCSLDFSPHPGDQLTVMTWNVQNLFDEVDDGSEYPEFDPEKGWRRADFWQRCESLAKVIRSAVDGGPDILVLEEVESAHALDVLNTRFLGDLGYSSSFITPAEYPGMRLAILSRFPIVRTGVHFPEVPGSDSLRPVLEAEWDLRGRPLVLLANHWKSRIPSPEVTEPLRRRSAEVLAQRIQELEQREPAPYILAVGDFNTSIELSRPWDLPAFSGTLEQTHLAGGVLADLWDQAGEPRGSYVYRGVWSSLDHILVASSSKRLGDWEAQDFHPVRYSPEPRPWGLRSRNGISDHFPLVVTLRRRA